MRLCDADMSAALESMLQRYGMDLRRIEDEAAIPGSYWGAPEAGLIGTVLHVRADTPLHSALHETAHIVCMDPQRRRQLHTDAGGDYAEEDSVCYLQILLARQLDVSETEICADMDAWGYTFRLGSAYAWFMQDADDARAWLLRHALIHTDGTPTWRCREQ